MTLEPLPYHRDIALFLETEEPELWQFFAEPTAREDAAAELLDQLLRTTYRLDPAAQPEIFRVAQEARERLALETPFALYQAEGETNANAAIVQSNDTVHIVFSGPLLRLLQPLELQSVIGHEFAHSLLWQKEGGRFLIAERILTNLAADPRSGVAYHQSARLFDLHTEVFADRGSLVASGDLETSVAGLVKVVTGFDQVSGAGYLSQAAEIFSKSTDLRSAETSHPETFIRAFALKLWRDVLAEAPAAADPEVEARIGKLLLPADGLENLDLLAQGELTRLTSRFLEDLLFPRILHSEAILGHARSFFPEFVPAPHTPAKTAILRAALNTLGQERLEYFCYLLLDFALIDPDLERLPLAAAFEASRRLGFAEAFEKILRKELQLKKRALHKLKAEVDALLLEGALDR